MEGSRVAALATALADSTRATTIAALLSGTVHTSGELARVCAVAPSTMSSHLGILVDAGLFRVEPAGRYRCFRITSRDVADLLERMDSLDSPETHTPKRPTPGQGLSVARSCYDHIAGQLGVDLRHAFVERTRIEIDDLQPHLTDLGTAFVTDLGIDVDHLRTLKRSMLRLDLDWTERRDQLVGSVAAALMTTTIERRWITRRSDKRQLTVTETGRREFADHFGLRF
jgi:DNA-binding transcriptional ArsR family regulator